MTQYQKQMREQALRKFKEYEVAKEILTRFLEDNDAPPNIRDAFEKCVRPPTVVWA